MLLATVAISGFSLFIIRLVRCTKFSGLSYELQISLWIPSGERRGRRLCIDTTTRILVINSCTFDRANTRKAGPCWHRLVHKSHITGLFLQNVSPRPIRTKGCRRHTPAPLATPASPLRGHAPCTLEPAPATHAAPHRSERGRQGAPLTRAWPPRQPAPCLGWFRTNTGGAGPRC